MNADDVAEVARKWDLVPHPEGGFYRETFRSKLSATVPGWEAPRAFATSILFLLPAGVRSARHRVRGDELWLWQSGAPMTLEIEGVRHIVGPDRDAGHELQCLVPGGAWQWATPDGDGWSLVACVVAPGFDFADFEISDVTP